jgi:hypothetical protein
MFFKMKIQHRKKMWNVSVRRKRITGRNAAWHVVTVKNKKQDRKNDPVLSMSGEI